MILIGLTGGIAVGKSTVCSILEEHGIRTIDCDAIVRELQLPNTAAVREIRAIWPQCVSAEGVLLREKLGEVVFGDAAARRQLAAIMNRKIFFAVLRRIAQEWWRCFTTRNRSSSSSSLIASNVVILDAPILYESKTFLLFVSSVVVVSCDEQQQLQRLVRRNPELGGEAEAKKRIAAQMPLAEKRKRAAYVIHNTSTTSELTANVNQSVEWMARQPHVRYPSVCAAGVAGALAAALVAVASCVV
jgi:dephospho-CoA kinase